MIDQTLLHVEWQSVALASLSFFVCAIIIFSCAYAPRLNGRETDLRAVQAAHSRPTPRLGGIAIFTALALSITFAPAAISGPYAGFILATVLLFAVGLLEDLGFHISPRRRLLAAAAASLLVIWLLGVWLPRADVPVLDVLVEHWAIGVPLTVFVTVGIVNGFNLIDGVNGLAAMTAIVAAVALSQIARQAGDTAMVQLTMMVAAVVFGFFLLNFPLGLIFLGDAGAYTLGFVLSWFGIAILFNAPEASPWAILLTLFWPVADTLLTIYRRSRRNAGAMLPDRLHMHQLVMRGLEVCFLDRARRRIANPLTTIVLAPFVIAPPVAGVLFWNQSLYAFLAVVAFGVLFVGAYVAGHPFIRRFRRFGTISSRSSSKGTRPNWQSQDISS